ncbi:acetylornithine deacetylase/succinyl-diaminopimelate desuccinylase-like protein [Sedimentibacter acidaminivorans]|uniref:Acetylornithine deacetylase/succinyl-diaminopimelate desuccinylase-like protein n=1 Tax=Sedimentibacter acidaminivorans TaxID=913099 RepID=A0ABS4GCG0_9FIRM|nr:M20/M25/M40 family metallo-hydrolase [Sedimentibacter acidaminivorans]MBP1925369.1 acetylornithine deacetylase/succinyl-diaminopimelate desuccinylase-like protein [Sedimentibacter acidaminivorans]
MKYSLNEEAINFISESKEEQLELLISLAKIPAPSHKEDKRAEFCKQWLEKNGAENVYIDDAKNVVYPINCESTDEIIVFMAHTDIVFGDEDEILVKNKDGRLYAPGVGDDTANVVNLLMCAKYVTQKKLSPQKGFVFIMNSCEEGLGNLKGSKKIVETFGTRIKEFISFDGYVGTCTNKAVGSQRYKVTITTEGGHSYWNFGNQNAIYFLSSMIQTLYTINPPKKEKTTYNVGNISGGTSVNTIAESASMLYEFRSLDKDCLKQLENFFWSIIDSYRKMNIGVDVKVIGIRPCDGDIDKIKLYNLTEKNKEIIKYYYDGEINLSASSTDSNIPLSIGIPANTIGTVKGGGAHTRGEWIDIESLNIGLKIALTMVLSYF